jgi:hypothetical protein
MRESTTNLLRTTLRFAIASSTILVASLLLWAMSYVVLFTFGIRMASTNRPVSTRLYLSGGSIVLFFHTFDEHAATSPRDTGMSAEAEIMLRRFSFFLRPMENVSSFGGFGAGRIESDPQVHTRAAFMPWYPWPLLAACRLAMRWRAASVKERRAARGCCETCGYDVRASSGVCPECGSRIEQREGMRTLA